MKNTYVTQPYLPPLDELMHYLEDIWHNKWLTNNVKFYQRFKIVRAQESGIIDKYYEIKPQSWYSSRLI